MTGPENDYHMDESDFEGVDETISEPGVPNDIKQPLNENGSIPHQEEMAEFAPDSDDADSYEDQSEFTLPTHEDPSEYITIDEPDSPKGSPGILAKSLFLGGCLTVMSLGGLLYLNSQGPIPDQAKMPELVLDKPVQTAELATVPQETVNSTGVPEALENLTASTSSETVSQPPDGLTINTDPVSAAPTIEALAELTDSRITLVSAANPKFILTADGDRFYIDDVLKESVQIVDIFADNVVIDVDATGTLEIPYNAKETL